MTCESGIITTQMLCDAKPDAEAFAAFINSTETTVDTRLGGLIPTLRGILESFRYKEPVVFASGLTITTGLQTVDYNGVIYALKPSVGFPYVTTASFVSDDWYVVQIVTTLGIDVRHFGAQGDGVTDDSSSILNAIASAPAGGAKICFPNTGNDYLCLSRINLKDKNNIILCGESGMSEQGSALRFTGTGSLPFIDMNGANGCGFTDMAVTYSSNSFSGDLISMGSNAHSNTTYNSRITNCFFGSTSPATIYTANALLRIGRTETLHVDGLNMSGTKNCVFGLDAAQSASNLSNNITLQNCKFSEYNNYAIRNPGESWSILSPHDLGRRDGQPAFLVVDDSSINARGVLIQNLRQNDLGSPVANAPLIDFVGSALCVMGGTTNIKTGVFIRARGTINGCSLFGVALQASSGYVFDFNEYGAAALQSKFVQVLGCGMSTINSFVGADIPPGTMYNNYNMSSLFIDELTVRDFTDT